MCGPIVFKLGEFETTLAFQHGEIKKVKTPQSTLTHWRRKHITLKGVGVDGCLYGGGQFLNRRVGPTTIAA